MATAAPPADQTADMLQKLSLDSQVKPLEVSEPNKKTSVYQYGSIDSANAVNGQIPVFERSVTPVLPEFMDPSICYLPNGYPSTAYYYGGFTGSGNYWDEYSSDLNPEGVDMTSGVYGDNGSLMYHHGFGYAPYAPYSPATSPVPTMGSDGQLYGPQHYQYPPYFPPLTPTSGSFTSTLAAPSQADLSAAADHKPLPVEAANATNSVGVTNSGIVKGNGSVPVKPTYQNSHNINNSYGRDALQGTFPASGYHGYPTPITWQDGSKFSDYQPRSVTSTAANSHGNNVLHSRNQNYRSNSHYTGHQNPAQISSISTNNGYINRMYPNKLYGQYGNSIRSGMGYGSTGYDLRTNGRGWLSVDNKYKPRGRSNGYFTGNENIDGLNELNRGPRAKAPKTLNSATVDVNGQTELLVGVHSEEKDISTACPDREQFNKDNFPVDYTDAKFFVIKSYSEDDVHKSIKYNVWASTPTGNKKLDAAYEEAQQKPSGCPVFLLFSVNTSGQFVGLAEMVGPVDFNKNVEYWQQDKWTGCFSLKWHIVKDVPNSLLKHITLENNENKPVTNSRDTQEVKLEQGLKLVKIFKEHPCKTCILDDFGFYESRQKTIQEKKAKQQQFQKQVWEGKNVDEKKEMSNGTQMSTDLATKIPQTDGGNGNEICENGSVLLEKKCVANGI